MSSLSVRESYSRGYEAGEQTIQRQQIGQVFDTGYELRCWIKEFGENRFLEKHGVLQYDATDRVHYISGFVDGYVGVGER